jgi:hypothetical protein
MGPDTTFLVVNTMLLPAWLLLIVAPRWRWTRRIAQSAVLPALVALLYAVLLGTSSFAEGASGSSLSGAMLIMAGSRWGAVVCWTHFVLFDFFVGAWIARDAEKEAIHHLAVVPCLILTLFIGPVGLLLYLALRAILRKRVTMER